MQIGFKLLAEAYEPREIVRQTVRAEQAGFDFVEASDHFHPWLESQGHSGFVWSMLAAAAAQTDTIELATGVTCPSIRYHPAVIAQAAATTQILSEGRFVLGLGSGERLNEHVVGGGWPSVRVRHELLRESIEIIRLLWSGGSHTYEGTHLTIEDARLWDLPDTDPLMPIAISGPKSAALAAQLGDGIFATEPKPELTEAYADAGGSGPAYAEVPLAYAPDEQAAAESAHHLFRFGLTGWKLQAELPNVVNFEQATQFIEPSDMTEVFACGPDADRHLEVARQFTDAGFDRLALISAGPDVDGFFDFYERELAEPLRALSPSKTAG